MPIWFILTRGDSRLLVNMNQVKFMTPNNPSDEAQGTTLHFGIVDDEYNYVIVGETLDQICTRLREALTP